jgi:hypothetical protein
MNGLVCNTTSHVFKFNLLALLKHDSNNGLGTKGKDKAEAVYQLNQLDWR